MSEHWIIPCNVKFYDVIEHFKKSTKVVWRNAFSIKQGDIAYLYLSSPYSQIKYKCVVVDDAVDEEKLNKNAYAIPKKKFNNYFSKKDKYIQIELLQTYPDGMFTLEALKEHGLGQVQIQARTDRRLQTFIDKKEESVKGGDE